MRLIKETHINFIAQRRWAMVLSLSLVVIGLASVAIHKGFNTSIDFAGGTLVEVRFDPPVPLEEVRAVVERAGFDGAEVTNFGGEEEVLIKVKAIGEAAEARRCLAN